LLSKWASGIKPTLELDFLGASALDSRITYTNATANRTYYNSSGVLSYAAANTARFDYNPSTLAARGLLIEEGRTNLILRSQEMDVAASGWNLSNTTVSANATTSPDGTTTADKIQEDTATASHYANNTTGSCTSGTTYTASVFLKAAERGFAFVVLGAAGAFPTTAISINLTSGAVSTATGTPLNAFTQTLPNGWFRVGFSLAATSTATGSIDIRTSTDGVWANRSYAGTAGSGIYAWGAQVEAGAFPTSYIATTSATVTRAADVATVGTLTPWFNASAGTIVVAAMVKVGTAMSLGRTLFGFDDTTANNRLISRVAPSTNTAGILCVNGGVVQTNTGITGASLTNEVLFKTAFAYTANDFAGVFNGGTPEVDSSGSIASGLTRALVGDAGTSNTQTNGWLQSIKYYPTRLPNSVLQSLTV